jgi:hypothetical protein
MERTFQRLRENVRALGQRALAWLRIQSCFFRKYPIRSERPVREIERRLRRRLRRTFRVAMN